VNRRKTNRRKTRPYCNNIKTNDRKSRADKRIMTKFRSSNIKSVNAHVSALSARTPVSFLNYQPFKELALPLSSYEGPGPNARRDEDSPYPLDIPVFSIIKTAPWSSGRSHPARLHRLKFHIVYKILIWPQAPSIQLLECNSIVVNI